MLFSIIGCHLLIAIFINYEVLLLSFREKILLINKTFGSNFWTKVLMMRLSHYMDCFWVMITLITRSTHCLNSIPLFSWSTLVKLFCIEYKFSFVCLEN